MLHNMTQTFVSTAFKEANQDLACVRFFSLSTAFHKRPISSCTCTSLWLCEDQLLFHLDRKNKRWNFYCTSEYSYPWLKYPKLLSAFVGERDYLEKPGSKDSFYVVFLKIDSSPLGSSPKPALKDKRYRVNRIHKITSSVSTLPVLVRTNLFYQIRPLRVNKTFTFFGALPLSRTVNKLFYSCLKLKKRKSSFVQRPENAFIVSHRFTQTIICVIDVQIISVFFFFSLFANSKAIK